VRPGTRKVFTASVATLAIVVGVSASACGAAQEKVIYIAPTGNDANTGTAALPVLTLGRAYQLAKPGAVVELAAGSYPYQQIARDPSKTSPANVVFRPAPGASVSVDMIDFGQEQLGVPAPANIVVRDIHVGYLRAWAGTDHLIWQNISGKHFDMFGVTNVRVLGGDFGPCQAPRDDDACVPRIAGSANILLDGVTIHDMTSTDLVNHHVDGLFIRGATNVVIRDSKFRGNMITNIRIQPQDCCANASITLENNWFAPALQGEGSATRADGVDVDQPFPGLLFRNNSFATGTGPQLLGTYSDARLVGNLMMNAQCAPGVTYAYNVVIPFSAYSGQTPCGRSDKVVASFGYLNEGGFDYHIGPSSPAIGSGDPSNCPGTDIDRQARTGACDAGADQR
jgi:hypothetical protein